MRTVLAVARRTRRSIRIQRRPQRLVDELRDVDEQIRPLTRTDGAFFFRVSMGIWRPEFAEVRNADPVPKEDVGPVCWGAPPPAGWRDRRRGAIPSFAIIAMKGARAYIRSHVVLTSRQTKPLCYDPLRCVA